MGGFECYVGHYAVGLSARGAREELNAHPTDSARSVARDRLHRYRAPARRYPCTRVEAVRGKVQ